MALWRYTRKDVEKIISNMRPLLVDDTHGVDHAQEELGKMNTK